MKRVAEALVARREGGHGTNARTPSAALGVLQPLLCELNDLGERTSSSRSCQYPTSTTAGHFLFSFGTGTMVMTSVCCRGCHRLGVLGCSEREMELPAQRGAIDVRAFAACSLAGVRTLLRAMMML